MSRWHRDVADDAALTLGRGSQLDHNFIVRAIIENVLNHGLRSVAALPVQDDHRHTCYVIS